MEISLQPWVLLILLSPISTVDVIDLLIKRANREENLDWDLFARLTGVFNELSYFIDHAKQFSSFYSNPDMIKIIEEMIEEDINSVDWEGLSANPAAFHLFKKYPDYVDINSYIQNPIVKSSESLMDEIIKTYELDENDWMQLSYNLTERQIREHQDKFDFYEGSDNPHAINVLKENQEEICWYGLSSNPAIFREVKDEAKNNY